MIFSDIEDTTFVAFYNVINNVLLKGHILRREMTTIPLLIDAKNINEAIIKAKRKIKKNIMLDEVREINIKEKENILKFYDIK